MLITGFMMTAITLRGIYRLKWIDHEFMFFIKNDAFAVNLVA